MQKYRIWLPICTRSHCQIEIKRMKNDWTIEKNFFQKLDIFERNWLTDWLRAESWDLRIRKLYINNNNNVKKPYLFRLSHSWAHSLSGLYLISECRNGMKWNRWMDGRIGWSVVHIQNYTNIGNLKCKETEEAICYTDRYIKQKRNGKNLSKKGFCVFEYIRGNCFFFFFSSTSNNLPCHWFFLF